jgi:hypothetical protein
MATARRFAASAALALPLLASLPALASEVEFPISKLVEVSPEIVLGRVASSTARREANGAIFTHMSFEVQYAVAGGVKAGEAIDLVYAGGEMPDGQSVSTSAQPRFEVGETYLVCLRQLANGSHDLACGLEGKFHVVRGTDGVLYALASSDRPIRGVSAGYFRYGPTATSVGEGWAKVIREDYLPAPRAIGEGTAWTTDLGAWCEAKPLDWLVRTLSSALGTVAGQLPELPGINDSAVRANAFPSLCGCGTHSGTEVLEQVPSSWANYGPNDWMMAQYNYYLNSVIARTASDGTYNWTNYPFQKNEFTGFPSSSDLNSVYGSPWGANTLGVTWSWGFCSTSSCCTIQEADISVNPAFNYVYDLDSALNAGGNTYLYQQVAIHEVGHSVGLMRSACGPESYQFNTPTVMFGGGLWYVEYFKGLHRADANILRNLWSGVRSAQNVVDMGVESWYADGDIFNATVSPALLMPGGSFTLNNVYVENMSPSAVPNVRLRVYLSSNRTISEGDILCAGELAWDSFGTNSSWLGNLTKSVPVGTPAGDYYIGLMVTYNGDAHQHDGVSQNDTTWLPTPIHVFEPLRPYFPPGMITPVHLSLSTSQSARMQVVTTGSTATADLPSCGGMTIGPCVSAEFLASETGYLSVGPAGTVGAAGFAQTATNWILGIYEVSPNGGQQLIATGCGDFSMQTARVTAPVKAGSQYIVKIGGAGQGSAIESPFTFDVTPNRPFGSAGALPLVYQGNTTFSNAAMPEAATQIPCAGTTSHGTWFLWHAPANGVLSADTCSPATKIANAISIHSPAVGGAVIGCGATGGSTPCTSQFGAFAQADVVGGQDYLVRVASLGTSTGDFSLNLTFGPSTASNGQCASAMQVSAGSAAAFSTDSGATTPVILCNGATANAKALWYKFTAPFAGRLRASTCPDLGGSASEATSVSIFDGCGTGAAALACDNDVCDGITTGAAIGLAAGRSVFVRVSSQEPGLGSVGGVTGKVAFVFSATCTGDFDGDGIVNGGDLGTLLSKWGTQIPPNGSADSAFDLNGDRVINGADLGIMLSKWGACP